MSRVWIERPIPSTETLPMDEFPPGTIAIHPDHDPVERCSCSRWENGDGDRYDSEMIGWIALVPVEAEEETRYAYAVQDDWVGDEKVTRLVTPWERM